MHVRSAKLRLGLGLDAQQALDDNVVDLCPHMRAVDAQLFQVRAKGTHAPFVATISLVAVVLDKGLVLLVDGVVGQVRVLRFRARHVLIAVSFGGKAH